MFVRSLEACQRSCVFTRNLKANGAKGDTLELFHQLYEQNMLKFYDFLADLFFSDLYAWGLIVCANEC